MKKYKVWVAIEEADEDNDSWMDLGLPLNLAEFDTLQEAEDFVFKLEATTAE